VLVMLLLLGKVLVMLLLLVKVLLFSTICCSW
jgi:hypothetical protein